MKEFSKECWGSQVATYHDGFHGKNGISKTCWEELVEACLGQSEDSEDDLDTHNANLSMLDHDCAHEISCMMPHFVHKM